MFAQNVKKQLIGNNLTWGFKMSSVHISHLNGKLEKFRAISVNTLSNKFCQKMHNVKPEKEIICTDCYSWALLQGFRKNVAVALQRNSDLLSSRVLAQKELPRIHDKEFRFMPTVN